METATEKTIYNTVVGTYIENGVTKNFYVSGLISAMASRK